MGVDGRGPAILPYAGIRTGQPQGDQISSDPDFFAASAAADPTIVRPHVVVLEREAVADAMLIGRIERLKLPTRLGCRTLYAPEVRSLAVMDGGMLGDGEDWTFRTMLANVRTALANRAADVAGSGSASATRRRIVAASAR